MPSDWPVIRARTIVPGAWSPASFVWAKPSVRPRSGRSIRSSTERPCIAARWRGDALAGSARRRAARSSHGRGRDLRHPGGGRARAGAEREDVQPGQAALLDQPQRVLEHRLGLGGEAGDQVGAEDDVGAGGADLLAEADGVVAEVAALHSLEDQVVAGLEGEVQVRHQARLAGDRLHEQRVGLDRVDGGEAQARQVGDAAEDRGDEVAEARRARQVGAPGGEVDAGQHDLDEAALRQAGDLLDDDAAGTERELPRP